MAKTPTRLQYGMLSAQQSAINLHPDDLSTQIVFFIAFLQKKDWKHQTVLGKTTIRLYYSECKSHPHRPFHYTFYFPNFFSPKHYYYPIPFHHIFYFSQFFLPKTLLLSHVLSADRLKHWVLSDHENLKGHYWLITRDRFWRWASKLKKYCGSLNLGIAIWTIPEDCDLSNGWFIGFQ